MPKPVDEHLEVLVFGRLLIRHRDPEVVDSIAVGSELVKDLCTHMGRRWTEQAVWKKGFPYQPW